MNQHTIVLPHGSMLLQEAVEGSSNYALFKHRGKWHVRYEYDQSSSYTGGGYALFYKDFGGKKKYPEKLELIGITPLSEEQAGRVVESRTEYKTVKLFKGADGRAYNTATEALSTYFTANNVDTSKRWVVLLDKK